MSKTIYQLPVSPDSGSVVELADGGRRFRKQLVKFGAWVNPHDPNKKMVLDKAWAERVMRNMADKVINKVPIVEGHPKTSAELLQATRGWLDGASIEEDGLYGEMRILAADTATGIDSNLIDDVSVSFDPNYVDKRTGAEVGPALLHVGLVNDPYLKGMTPFQALSDSANVIMLSESKEHEVSTVSIKNEHEFPVTVKFDVDGKEETVTIEAGKEAEVPESAAEGVKALVSEAKAPAAADDEADRKAAEEKEAADKAAAEKAEADAKAAEEAKANLSELERTKLELSETKAKLAAQETEKTYDKMLRDGRLVPAQKDTFVALSAAALEASTTVNLSDGTTKTFPELLAEFLEAGPKRVDFSEQGKSGDEHEKTPWDSLSEGAKEANLKMGIRADEYNKVNAPAAQ